LIFYSIYKRAIAHTSRGLKCIIHFLRTLMLATSLVKHEGRAVDLGVNQQANQYYRELVQLNEKENLSWSELEKWSHIVYHPLYLEFRQGVNAYRRKMDAIQRLETRAKLATIDYIRLSLNEEEDHATCGKRFPSLCFPDLLHVIISILSSSEETNLTSSSESFP